MNRKPVRRKKHVPAIQADPVELPDLVTAAQILAQAQEDHYRRLVEFSKCSSAVLASAYWACRELRRRADTYEKLQKQNRTN